MPLLLAGEGDRLDLGHLSAMLITGDGDTDTGTGTCEVEEYPAVRLIVGRLSHPGNRKRNRIAALLLDVYLPAVADRWWLDLRGTVAITGLCHCGAPADLPASIYNMARAMSDSISG